MEWFLLNAGKVEGPFQSKALKEKIERSEIDAATFVCRQGDPHWKPLEELREEIIESAKPDEELKNWILLTENLELALSKEQEGQFVQSGPYTTLEIMDLLQSGKAKYSDFIWKTGFEKWVRINEVDEFFGAPKTAQVSVAESVQSTGSAQSTEALIAEPALPDATMAEENDAELFRQVLEQTHLTNYDFVDEEKAPAEANPINEAVFKTAEPPPEEEIKPVTSGPMFALSSMAVPEVIENIKAEEPPARKNPDVIANLIEGAQKNFPLLMTGLAGILVIMVGVWALSLAKDDSVESARLPPVQQQPAKKIEAPKPVEAAKPIAQKSIAAVAKPAEVPTAPAVKIERAAPARAVKPIAVKTKPVVKPNERPATRQARAAAAKAAIEKIAAEEERQSNYNDQLDQMATRLLHRAERLETQYENLRLNPLEWRRFYQAFNSELQKTATAPADKTLEKSLLYRQLKIGRNRLNDRAEMMNKSVMQSQPVSSDFDSEDLPGLFRNIQGQIQKR